MFEKKKDNFYQEEQVCFRLDKIGAITEVYNSGKFFVQYDVLLDNTKQTFKLQAPRFPEQTTEENTKILKERRDKFYKAWTDYVND